MIFGRLFTQMHQGSGSETGERKRRLFRRLCQEERPPRKKLYDRKLVREEKLLYSHILSRQISNTAMFIPCTSFLFNFLQTSKALPQSQSYRYPLIDVLRRFEK